MLFNEWYYNIESEIFRFVVAYVACVIVDLVLWGGVHIFCDEKWWYTTNDIEMSRQVIQLRNRLDSGTKTENIQ